jgi:hypothetical protein
MITRCYGASSALTTALCPLDSSPQLIFALSWQMRLRTSSTVPFSIQYALHPPFPCPGSAVVTHDGVIPRIEDRCRRALSFDLGPLENILHKL